MKAHRVRRHHPSLRLLVSLLCWLLLLLSAPHLCAQGYPVDTNQFMMRPYGPLPASAYGLRPLYGLNPGEFWIGTYIESGPPHAKPRDWAGFWGWADTMGFRILESRENLVWHLNGDTTAVDSLIAAAQGHDGAQWHQRVIAEINPVDVMGLGQEIVLFPFDSMQSWYWKNLFVERGGGSRTLNSTMLDDWSRASSEQVYDSITTAGGDTILKNMAMSYDSVEQNRRWRGARPSDYRVWAGSFPKQHIRPFDPRFLYILVRGHLFDENNGGLGYDSNAADALLAIDIVDERDSGTLCAPRAAIVDSLSHADSLIQRAEMVPTTQTTRSEHVYRTLYITKRMLQPDTTGVGASISPERWNTYRDALFVVDMLHDSLGLSGPWSKSCPDCYANENQHLEQRFDLRVRWTGREKLALRSVILRDQQAQLTLGTLQRDDSAALQLRTTLLHRTNRVMRGPRWLASPALDDSANLANSESDYQDRRKKIIRLYVGDEGASATASSFNFVDSLLYRTFSGVNADDRQRGLRAWHGGNGGIKPYLSSHDAITAETYAFVSPDINAPWLGHRFNATWFGVSLDAPPSIREHNGGRFHIPELLLTEDSVRAATRLLQRQGFGMNVDGRYSWPINVQQVLHLAEDARRSRQSGHPLIQWVQSMIQIYLRWRTDAGEIGRNAANTADSVTTVTTDIYRDTLFGHLPEPSETRALLNMGLCYGARGVHYSQTGFYNNAYDATPTVVNGDTSYNYRGSDLGLIGPTLTDTSDITNVVLRTNGLSPSWSDTIPGMYTGWATARKGVQWLNRVWVPGVWQYLKNLQWRDGYSIQFAVPQTWGSFVYRDSATLAERHTRVSRPLDTSDIVRSVRAYDRLGRRDAPEETYVEIGLFDSVPNMMHPGYDTNHLFVVQRRTFERPDDVNSASPRGMLMDSLAEWRKVFVQLHISHPDNSLYNYVRVHELAADTTRAPWMASARQALDTVVHTDSAFSLWMRPGGGALLRITFVNPGDTVVGDLAFNNAKHVFFDGRRYHAVVAHFEGNANDTSSINDVIDYYWSKPVDSVERRVEWNAPTQVSYPRDICDTMRSRNRHPALTVRRIGDSTLVTVVWSAYAGVGPTPRRQIVTRSILLDSAGMVAIPVGTMETIGYYKGENPAAFGAWGTPTVCALDGADVFAWSDSATGIVARLRTRITTYAQCAASSWSDCDTVSRSVASATPYIPLYAQFPSLPPVAHVASRDSNIGIAWEQHVAYPIRQGFFITYGTGSLIYYKRLVHNPGAPILTSQNDFVVTPVGTFRHPSLDLWQDVWYQCFEGVAYEEGVPRTYPFSGALVPQNLWFRPIATETRLRGGWNPFWDSIGTTWGWAFYRHTARLTLSDIASGELWPSAAPLNEVMAIADTADTAHFAVAYAETATLWDSSSVRHLWQTQVRYGTSTATPGFPKHYSISGYHPAVSGTGTKQATRAVTLYESDRQANREGNARIGPTHQFFARLGRPRGYLATGREVMLLDSFRIGATVGMTDLWLSDEEASRPLEMAARSSTSALIDTLAAAVGMVRSAPFSTHDSVTVGVRAVGWLNGDSTYLTSVGMVINLRWELVEESGGSVVAVLDSATLDALHPVHDSLVERELDLVSGSYRVRLVVDTAGIVPMGLSAQESRYPVTETSMWVEELAAKLVRQGEARGARVRLDVQPNPASDRAEVLVSVPNEGEVRVVLHTVEGRVVGVAYQGALGRGRYSVPLRLSGLAAGSYLVELVAGRNRLTRQLIVR